MGDLLGERGPGPDDRHVPQEDVHEVRQLVDAGPAQEGAERVQPGVAPELEHRAVGLVEVVQLVTLLVGVGDHAAQLVHLEGPAAAADPFLAVERTLPGDDHDPGHGGQRDRQGDDQPDGRHGHVHRALGRLVPARDAADGNPVERRGGRRPAEPGLECAHVRTALKIEAIRSPT